MIPRARRKLLLLLRGPFEVGQSPSGACANCGADRGPTRRFAACGPGAHQRPVPGLGSHGRGLGGPAQVRREGRRWLWGRATGGKGGTAPQTCLEGAGRGRAPRDVAAGHEPPLPTSSGGTIPASVNPTCPRDGTPGLVVAPCLTGSPRPPPRLDTFPPTPVPNPLRLGASLPASRHRVRLPPGWRRRWRLGRSLGRRGRGAAVAVMPAVAAATR